MVRFTQTDGTTFTGLNAPDGSLYGVKDTGSSFVGVYHPCGAFNLNVVDGSSWVGAYSPRGSLNVYVGDGSPYGAMSIVDVSGTLGGSYPNNTILEAGGPTIETGGYALAL